jgi:hypothetical protein
MQQADRIGFVLIAASVAKLLGSFYHPILGRIAGPGGEFFDGGYRNVEDG